MYANNDGLQVPGDHAWVAFLEMLRDKGVRVRILTNSFHHRRIGSACRLSRYRRALLRIGVELYELNKGLSKAGRKVMKQGGIGDSRASLPGLNIV